MTASALARDARARPDLFIWAGPIAGDVLRDWLHTHAHAMDCCPPDLVALWQETGGGDFFETETILGPFGDPQLGDGVLEVNRALRLRGLPESLLVFHTGSSLSAVDLVAGDYVELDPDRFVPLRRFASLDAWYASTVRAELAARYGLE